PRLRRPLSRAAASPLRPPARPAALRRPPRRAPLPPAAAAGRTHRPTPPALRTVPCLCLILAPPRPRRGWGPRLWKRLPLVRARRRSSGIGSRWLRRRRRRERGMVGPLGGGLTAVAASGAPIGHGFGSPASGVKLLAPLAPIRQRELHYSATVAYFAAVLGAIGCYRLLLPPRGNLELCGSFCMEKPSSELRRRLYTDMLPSGRDGARDTTRVRDADCLDHRAGAREAWVLLELCRSDHAARREEGSFYHGVVVRYILPIIIQE
ncbi:unnamed protein product, partial [Urochloa humidicola]